MVIKLKTLNKLKDLACFVNVYQIKYSSNKLLTYGLNGCFTVMILSENADVGVLSHFPPFFFKRFSNEFIAIIQRLQLDKVNCVVLLHERDEGNSGIFSNLNNYINQIFNNRVLSLEYHYYNSDDIGIVEFDIKGKFWNSDQFGKKNII